MMDIWNCANCGATGNKGNACRKCLALKPVEPPKPKTAVYAPPCIYCGKPTQAKRYQRQSTFGPMTLTGQFCPHCDSWQV